MLSPLPIFSARSKKGSAAWAKPLNNIYIYIYIYIYMLTYIYVTLECIEALNYGLWACLVQLKSIVIRDCVATYPSRFLVARHRYGSAIPI